MQLYMWKKCHSISRTAFINGRHMPQCNETKILVSGKAFVNQIGMKYDMVISFHLENGKPIIGMRGIIMGYAQL